MPKQALAPLPVPPDALARLCNDVMRRGGEAQCFTIDVDDAIAMNIAEPCDRCGQAGDWSCCHEDPSDWKTADGFVDLRNPEVSE